MNHVVTYPRVSFARNLLVFPLAGLTLAACGGGSGTEHGAGSPSDGGGAQEDARSRTSEDASDAECAADAGQDASRDGAHDGAVGADGSGGASCGAETCFSGETCVSGSCAFTACVGASVPGDYATVAEAVAALTASGGGTVCLAAHEYGEDVDVMSAGTGAITIQGSSPQTTSLTSLSYWSASTPSLSLVGLTVHALAVNVTGAGSVSLSLRACTLDGAAAESSGLTGAFEVSAEAGQATLVLDGVDLSAQPGDTALVVVLGEPSPTGMDLSLTVENSYFHGATYGALLEAESFGPGPGPGPYEVRSTFLDDTFVGLSTLAFIDQLTPVAPSEVVTAAIYNSLFVDNANALSYSDGPAVGNNALFGNTVSYAGAAASGPGYVTSNPLLDTSTTPPGLASRSPCIGAGDAAHSPDHDFWGTPRGTSIDIGAVQGSH